MSDNKKTNTVELFHEQGCMPDRYYYQLNGKSAQENYADWHNNMIEQYGENEDDLSGVHITSEVKIK